MAAVDSFHLLYRELARSCDCYVETLALVGACYTLSKAAVCLGNCYSLIRLHVIPRLSSPGNLCQRYGKWAIISGASGALVRAYAEELARRGISLILISSSIGEVEGHGLPTLLVQADLSQGPSACKAITDAIRGKEVGLVINSLDGSGERCRNLLDLSESGVWDAISRDVLTATLVTRLALPAMLERGRGAVVNISSGSRLRLSPSAAFLDHFSRSLHHEYGQRGIFVQSLLPCRVATGSPEDAGSVLVPCPRVYARHALSTLGVSHRTTGYWPHTLQFQMEQWLPEWMWTLRTRMCAWST